MAGGRCRVPTHNPAWTRPRLLPMARFVTAAGSRIHAYGNAHILLPMPLFTLRAQFMPLHRTLLRYLTDGLTRHSGGFQLPHSAPPPTPPPRNSRPTPAQRSRTCAVWQAFRATRFTAFPRYTFTRHLLVAAGQRTGLRARFTRFNLPHASTTLPAPFGSITPLPFVAPLVAVRTWTLVPSRTATARPPDTFRFATTAGTACWACGCPCDAAPTAWTLFTRFVACRGVLLTLRRRAV